MPCISTGPKHFDEGTGVEILNGCEGLSPQRLPERVAGDHNAILILERDHAGACDHGLLGVRNVPRPRLVQVVAINQQGL